MIFRRLLIDGAVFSTSALIIVLLNAGQYFMGYGGYGFVKGVDPSGLTLGFPFTYYYFSFAVYEGEVIYLGIIGNLVFAAVIGAIAGVIAALLRSRLATSSP
ncbi:hypothetical protein BH20ACI2_BH20ACI2_25620 [soil metagenome]